VVADSRLATLTDPADGWRQIKGIAQQINIATHYQGVAFYKVINNIDISPSSMCAAI
jgi:hypothetical protein